MADADDIRPYANQRAKIRLTPLTIAEFLDLPDGMMPVAIYAESDPPGIMVVLEGPALDFVEPDTEAPLLGGMNQRVDHLADEETGKVYRRFCWSASPVT